MIMLVFTAFYKSCECVAYSNRFLEQEGLATIGHLVADTFQNTPFMVPVYSEINHINYIFDFGEEGRKEDDTIITSRNSVLCAY